MADYLSYNEVLSAATRAARCCECNQPIPKKSLYWNLTCSEHGGIVQVFRTCEACHTQRLEFCTVEFTPTNLLADLETIRSKVSYDDVRTWAMLVNAISLLRQRRAGAGPKPRIPTTPTPLRGVRVVRGGFKT